ncbi:MAG: hypothetical protein JNM17_34330 [Archangium sp.]|nr:hypothetical protein [Archangium sp.]
MPNFFSFLSHAVSRRFVDLVSCASITSARFCTQLKFDNFGVVKSSFTVAMVNERGCFFSCFGGCFFTPSGNCIGGQRGMGGFGAAIRMPWLS